MVVQHIQTFIKRLIPVRFGLVPRVHSESARSQAKIARHLQKTHGLAAMLKYFQRVSTLFLNSIAFLTGEYSLSRKTNLPVLTRPCLTKQFQVRVCCRAKWPRVLRRL